MKNTQFPFRIFAIFICAMFFSGAIMSATENKKFKSLTFSDGLSDLLINNIYKDSTGFVWFGTETSLDRFDGNRIKRFKVETENRLSKRVLDIIEGGKGVIYAGTNQGLFRLKPGEERLAHVEPKIIDAPVTSLVYRNDGYLYAASTHGIFVYNTKNGHVNHILLVPDNLSSQNNIKCLYPDDKKGLWALTASKLWSLDNEGNVITSYDLPQGVVANRMLVIDEILYIATDGRGVLRFDVEAYKFLTPINTGNDVVTSMSKDDDGILIIGTDGEGVYYYSIKENRIIRHITTSSGVPNLRSNSVYSVLFDDEGILWVGYYQSGVDYLPERKEEVILVQGDGIPELPDLHVRSFKRSDRFLVIGTHNGLYLVDQESHNVRKYDKPQINSNIVLDVEYAAGKFYIGTFHGGMYVLTPETGVIEKFGLPEMDDISIFSLCLDAQGNLWAGTSQGIYTFGLNNSSVSHITSSNSHLPDGYVFDIFFDSMGRGWFCTENGVAIRTADGVITSALPAGFDNKLKIRVIYEDKDHNLYFAPDRGEMWRSDLSLRNFGPVTIGVDGRFSQITSIVEDDNGVLWLGTDRGLVKYFPDGSFDIINNVGGRKNPSYTLAKAYKSKNGDLIFGSTLGLHMVKGDFATGDTVVSVKPLIISDITSKGNSVFKRLKYDTDQNSYVLKLGNEEHDISVDVTDLKFDDKELFEFEYILEGFDTHWREGNGLSSISYAEIPPGNYTLKIRKPGNNDSEININVKKAAAWNWLLLLSIVLGAVVIFATLSYFQLKKRHKEEIDRILSSRVIVNDKEKSGENSYDDNVPYKNMRLSDEECRRLLKKLDVLMKEQKPYKNTDLKIGELARLSDTSTHALSFLFNQYLKKSYYDYVNEFRVNEFKRMVKDGDASKYTLSTLAERCGFSSRASFFRHFKNIAGVTPAEYLKGKVQ